MGIKKPKFDLNEVVENYSHGMSALAQVSEVATDALQALTKLQTEFAKESMEEVSGLERQMMAAPAGQRAGLSQQALTQGFHRMMTHGNALTQMLAQSGKDMVQSVGQKAKEEGA